jgi:hypothetical protein
VPTVEERQFGLDTRTRNRTVQHPMRGIKRAHPLGEKFASFIQQALALVRTLASTAGESFRARKPEVQYLKRDIKRAHGLDAKFASFTQQALALVRRSPVSPRSCKLHLPSARSYHEAPYIDSKRNSQDPLSQCKYSHDAPAPRDKIPCHRRDRCGYSHNMPTSKENGSGLDSKRTDRDSQSDGPTPNDQFI